MDEIRRGESLDQHLAEEEPDITEFILDEVDEEPRAGRLVAPDEGVHSPEEGREWARDAGRAGWAASAEEAAMHIVEEQ
jgi:hypothetical protein